jgi:hypothetical protein
MWCRRKLGVWLAVDALKVVQRPSLLQDGEKLFCRCTASAGSAMSTVRTASATTFTFSSSVDHACEAVFYNFRRVDLRYSGRTFKFTVRNKP